MNQQSLKSTVLVVVVVVGGDGGLTLHLLTVKTYMKNNDLKFELQLTEIDKGEEGEIAAEGWRVRELDCDWEDSVTPEPDGL